MKRVQGTRLPSLGSAVSIDTQRPARSARETYIDLKWSTCLKCRLFLPTLGKSVGVIVHTFTIRAQLLRTLVVQICQHLDRARSHRLTLFQACAWISVVPILALDVCLVDFSALQTNVLGGGHQQGARWCRAPVTSTRRIRLFRYAHDINMYAVSARPHPIFFLGCFFSPRDAFLKQRGAFFVRWGRQLTHGNRPSM